MPIQQRCDGLRHPSHDGDLVVTPRARLVLHHHAEHPQALAARDERHAEPSPITHGERPPLVDPIVVEAIDIVHHQRFMRGIAGDQPGQWEVIVPKGVAAVRRPAGDVAEPVGLDERRECGVGVERPAQLLELCVQPVDDLSRLHLERPLRQRQQHPLEASETICRILLRANPRDVPQRHHVATHERVVHAGGADVVPVPGVVSGSNAHLGHAGVLAVECERECLDRLVLIVGVEHGQEVPTDHVRRLEPQVGLDTRVGIPDPPFAIDHDQDLAHIGQHRRHAALAGPERIGGTVAAEQVRHRVGHLPEQFGLVVAPPVVDVDVRHPEHAQQHASDPQRRSPADAPGRFGEGSAQLDAPRRVVGTPLVDRTTL